MKMYCLDWLIPEEMLTINSHLGLFQYNRLTFGISSALGILQSVMDVILSGLTNTSCFAV